MSKAMYFIVDTAHQDFQTMLTLAQQANTVFGGTSQLSWRYNNNETKAMAKVMGTSDTWYEDSVWFNHPAILQAYTREEHSSLLVELEKPEWNNDIMGSPQE